VAWEIESSDQVKGWRGSLDAISAERFEAALQLLQQSGPGLGRPTADTVHHSRHQNMKELRVGSMRALFAFDSRRTAVLLVAGDKSNDWKGWYRRNVPVADRLFDAHQRSIGGGDHRWRALGIGAKSAASER
jgi:hypothetical protein